MVPSPSHSPLFKGVADPLIASELADPARTLKSGDSKLQVLCRTNAIDHISSSGASCCRATRVNRLLNRLRKSGQAINDRAERWCSRTVLRAS